MTAVELSKQQVVNTDPKAIQEINFTGNPKRVGNTTKFFIFEEVEETILDLPQGTVRVLWIYFTLM